MMRISIAEKKGFLMVVLLIFVAVLFIVNAPRAEAAGLTFSASTTVSLTNPAETWTIAGSSNASSVQVGTGNMVVAMQNTDSITLSVSNRNFSLAGLSSSAVVTRSSLCYLNTGNQQAILTLTATQDETITVTTGACGDYSSGRGGPQELSTYGGERFSTSPTPTPTATPPSATPTSTNGFTVLPATPTVPQIQLAINEVLQKIAQLQANPSVPDILNQLQRLVIRIALIQQVVTGGVSASTGDGGAITQPLNQGSSGDQVTALQNFLKSQGSSVYPEGLVTGYFGPLTREAVERFQEKHGIANEGDPGYGFAGPKTRAKINSLLGL